MENIEETVVETHEEWALRKKREGMRVTRFQAKAALMNAGLLEQAQSAVDANNDPIISLAWEEAAFERLSPMVDQLGKDMGLTPKQLDDLFESAKWISA